MRNEHQNALVSFEFLFEPDTSVQIQVICRLVEQHQVRLQEESARERDAHSPSTREIGELLLLHVSSETETS